MPMVFLGLGANLDPLEHLAQAARKIEELGPIQCSRIYQSAPYHQLDQPPYCNQVIALETQFSPEALLHSLLQIELQIGRVRGKVRWQNRKIDIDILDFAGQIIENETLTLPHYDMAGRDFFLLPLAELAPDYRHPVTGKDIAKMLGEIPDNLITHASPIKTTP